MYYTDLVLQAHQCRCQSHLHIDNSTCDSLKDCQELGDHRFLGDTYETVTCLHVVIDLTYMSS